MKTLQKILLVLVVSVCLVAVMPHIEVRAAQAAIDGITINDKVEGQENLQKVAGSILTFLQIASGIAAVIMIAVTGFRYIIETPEVKGELKKNMFPIIVGIVLVFFATSIAKFFIGIFNSNG